MKKLFCVLALLLVLPRAGAVSARGAVVIDADTGETLFEQNADSRLPMASTTKIMTALVALGEGDLDRVGEGIHARLEPAAGLDVEFDELCHV